MIFDPTNKKVFDKYQLYMGNYLKLVKSENTFKYM